MYTLYSSQLFSSLMRRSLCGAAIALVFYSICTC